MFDVGELIVYSSHGICKVDGIIEKEIMGDTKYYYELHPIYAPSLKISIPVDRAQSVLLELMNKKTAQNLLETIHSQKLEWIEKSTHRNLRYSQIAKQGNREDVAAIITNLMQYKLTQEEQNKKISQQDQLLLNSCQQSLFNEMAIALDLTYEEVSSRVSEAMYTN